MYLTKRCILLIWIPHLHMGCNLIRPRTGHECLKQLLIVEGTLQEMISKYERQEEEITENIKTRLADGVAKKKLVNAMRRKKVVQHYIDICSKRVESIVAKRYAMEQLTITKMQIDAMKDTSVVFKQFTRLHDVDKVEEMNETLQELTEQVMDINNVFENDTLVFDDDELEAELNSLVESPRHIVATIETTHQDNVEESRLPILSTESHLLVAAT